MTRRKCFCIALAKFYKLSVKDKKLKPQRKVQFKVAAKVSHI